jgi:hypothetical protein
VNDPLVVPIVLAGVLNSIAVAIGILINNARLSDLMNHMEACFDQVDRRFDKLDQRKASPKRPEER